MALGPRWLDLPECRPTTAVIYLARGADPEWRAESAAFRQAYLACPAGYPHELVLLTKGFADPSDLRELHRDFSNLADRTIAVPDGSFDLGAYRDAAGRIAHERVCFLNSGSRPASPDWLRKLALHLDRDGVGLVGATGSYESLRHLGADFPPFPNPHLRSNAFLIDRALFLSLIGGAVFTTKADAYRFENGRESLTRKVEARGFGVRVVGRNARAYPPRFWPVSATFRAGEQTNLLVEDGQTRLYASHPPPVKAAFLHKTWGSSAMPAADGRP